jgi:hypothetical protein
MNFFDTFGSNWGKSWLVRGIFFFKKMRCLDLGEFFKDVCLLRGLMKDWGVISDGFRGLSLSAELCGKVGSIGRVTGLRFRGWRPRMDGLGRAMWFWFFVAKEGYEYIGVEGGSGGDYSLFRRDDGKMVILYVGESERGLGGYLHSLIHRRTIVIITWRGQYRLDGDRSNGGMLRRGGDWVDYVGGGGSEYCLFGSLSGGRNYDEKDVEDDGIFMRVGMRKNVGCLVGCDRS